ncbi:hypothetical protein [Clostridium gasigenes]|uniref:hypothetical protein n=1 Tax=Clostridium gasigenes TaxID=94869 RepID=UPI001C0ADFEE|nr:hypothetical protein [Clostridium gasigenes]MBU3104782.1 hypothetical protein [Clostridium gasigenes]
MINFLIKVKYYEKNNKNVYDNILFYKYSDFGKWFIKNRENTEILDVVGRV